MDVFFKPERIKGNPMNLLKSDVWAMGMTLLEFVQNKYPYPPDLSTVELMMHIVNGDVSNFPFPRGEAMLIESFQASTTARRRECCMESSNERLLHAMVGHRRCICNRDTLLIYCPVSS